MNLRKSSLALVFLLISPHTNADSWLEEIKDVSKSVVKPIANTSKSIGKSMESERINKDIEEIIKEDGSTPSLVLCPEGPPCSKEPGKEEKEK